MQKTEFTIMVDVSGWAGNVDEFVCAALTGLGSEYERHGYEEGLGLFQALFCDTDEDNEDMFSRPDALHEDLFGTRVFDEEYGRFPYGVEADYSDRTHSYVLLAFEGDENDVKEAVRVWREKIPNMRLDGGTHSVTILGFKIMKRVTTVEEWAEQL